MDLSTSLTEPISCIKSKILERSPKEYRNFKSFQISCILAIMLYLISGETKWTNHETTMLLHLFQTV